MVNATSDVSSVLAAALRDMDDIIASAEMNIEDGHANSVSNANSISVGNSVPNANSVPSALSEQMMLLRRRLLSDSDGQFLSQEERQNAKLLHETLSRFFNSPDLSVGALNYQQQLAQLQRDRDELNFKLTMLRNEFMQNQQKTHELEEVLRQKSERLTNTERQLQQELLLKRKIEADRLELMTDLPALKLKVMAAEREKRDWEEKFQRLAEGRLKLNSSQDGYWNPMTNNTSSSSRDGRPPRPVSVNKNPKQMVNHERTNSDELMTAHDPKMNSLGRHCVTLPRNHALREISAQLSQDFQNLHVGNNHNGVAHHIDSNSGIPSRGGSVPPVRLRTGLSNSAPELAHPDRVILRGTSEEPPNKSPVLSRQDNKTKGLLKFLAKLKRSTSHSVELSTGTFHRSSVGSRFLQNSITNNDARAFMFPMDSWDNATVLRWFEKLGLSHYVEGRNLPSLRDGKTLLEANESVLERELSVKHPLHRRKLLMHLDFYRIANSPHNEQMKYICTVLDYKWVLCWLDDMGLPQLKDAFSEARIDACMLHALTMEDLSILEVSSQLHYLSIRWGIYLLRSRNFDASCYIRRSVNTDKEASSTFSPKDVAQWTTHRVMEWLESIELGEYAANLRGSGIHGALLVYEDEVTDDVFASILSIPESKTLLRRHLSFKFRELLGEALSQRKYAVAAQSGYTPLSPSTKLKAFVSRGSFSLSRFRKRNVPNPRHTLVCPIDPSPKMNERSEESFLNRSRDDASNASSGSRPHSSTDSAASTPYNMP